MIRIDFPVSMKSAMISIVPYTARPIRQVSPTTLPFRLRIARDPVEGALDARPVVVAERADVLDDVLQVRVPDLALEELDLAVRVARLGAAAEVEDDLDQRFPVREGMERIHDLRRQRREEHAQVVGCVALPILGSHAGCSSVHPLSERLPARGAARRRGRGFPS